ncbi:MAG: hypothetical protein KF914_18580 [Rhizobiaceae bacterium]|nr:hypothetical protein [Rhizobiaceae bacterium]
MADGYWFGLAVVILLVALALGFRRWGRRDLGPSGETLLARFVLISTAIGGLLGAPFWWFDLPPSFAWDLPPVASRMLAAAAAAFGVAGVLMLERPSEGRTRLYLLLIVIYLLPLALVAVGLHFDRFDFSMPVTYGFFAVVVVLTIGSLRTLLAGSPSEDGRAVPGFASAWLLAGGLVTGAWGLALFATPSRPDFPLVFNWAQDPLTSRLIAAMLITIAAAFLLSRADLGRARLALVFAAIYGAGVVAACAVSALYAKPVPPLYTAGFAIVAVASLAAFAVSRRRA